ncbi:GDP-mannose 4,6-dehydratase [Candidatus Bathyarchaeota archaeon]|nr:GDP-mannose 4,6-dehydratase [Candidatus Bathyarchaeota archaeon]
MEQLQNKRILVTGGAGFVGYHLCKKLLDFTPNLTIYDDLSGGKPENIKDLPRNVNFVKGDIRDSKRLDGLEKQDFIFHLAAQVIVPYSMEHPKEDFEINALGTLNALEKARKDKAKLVYTSSAAVYGNTEKVPTPENQELAPASFYGLSKLVGEQYCNKYHAEYGQDLTIVRFANVYGARCHGVIDDFLDKLSKKSKELEIIGTGQQARDFVHISDIVDALLLSATKSNAVGKTYNLSYGKAMKIIDLAKTILRILELNNTKIVTTNVPWKGDIRTILLDSNKAKRELHWNPKIRIEDHLRKLIIERRIRIGQTSN